MWNMKNLLFGLLMVLCDAACMFSVVLGKETNFGMFTTGNFAPTGIVVFTFAAFIFLRNAKRY